MKLQFMYIRVRGGSFAHVFTIIPLDMAAVLMVWYIYLFTIIYGSCTDGLVYLVFCIYDRYELLLCSLVYFVVVYNITSSVQIGDQKQVKFLILTLNFDIFQPFLHIVYICKQCYICVNVLWNFMKQYAKRSNTESCQSRIQDLHDIWNLQHCIWIYLLSEVG